MGCKINQLFETKTISLQDLKNKTLVVDSFNQLYMFLSTIRQPNGDLLKDSQGRVTSHLIGLFSRFTKLIENNTKLIFVFDGEAHPLKHAEQKRRKEIKQQAQKDYDDAKLMDDLEAMKKYAQRTARLTGEMIEDSKQLIRALGCPIVEAPSEGEAQASYLVSKGLAYAVLSQDADTLLFGASKAIKNLTISQKKKVVGKFQTVSIQPELTELQSNLTRLELSQDQLIAMSIMIGTDFNIGGIPRIGPKKAYKLIKENEDSQEAFEKIFTELKWEEHFQIKWQEIFDLIKNMPVEKSPELEFKNPDKEALIKCLVEKHEFSINRIDMFMEKFKKPKNKSLSDFF